MSRLRPIEARRLLRYLARHGFHAVSQSGSHHKLRRPDGTTLIVPVHSDQPVKAGLVLKILKQAGIDPHEAMDEL